MFLIRWITRVFAWVWRLFVPEINPTLTEKWVGGWVYDADGNPEKQAKVTAQLSNRIVRSTDNLIIENDEPVSTTTDDTGYWVMQLHPNNLAGDLPLNTRWKITEPSGWSEDIFIPWDHASGGSAAAPIPYSTLVGAGPVLNPADTSALATAVSDIANLKTWFGLLAAANKAGLEAEGKSTTLVDAALAGSTLATDSVNGIIAASDFTILKTFRTAGTNDPAKLARIRSNGTLVIPKADDPTAVSIDGTGGAYVSNTTGLLNVQIGGVAGRTTLAPSLSSPSWKLTSPVAVPSTTYQDLTTFSAVAGATYQVIGMIWYSGVPSGDDLRVRFSPMPAGATFPTGGIGLDSLTPAANAGVGSVNTTLALAPAALTFAGQLQTSPASDPVCGAYIYGTLTVGATAGTIKLQVSKGADTGADGVIAAGSALFVERWG